MKTLNQQIPALIVATLLSLVFNNASAQSCNPQGNQTSYGTNNVWRGYVYTGISFNTYRGYVTEGTSASPDFDQNFGGDNVTYSTSGCSISTEVFSVRYKLRKTFTAGTYQITVGGDDGYRFSVDGGSTWVINQWNDHSYQTTTIDVALSGSHNLVLEYYERNVNNRVSIRIESPCAQAENPATYGSGEWIGYVYAGMSFNTYKGSFGEGTTSNPNFDQNFGGDNTTFNTSGCAVTTNNFSVRYRMNRTLANGNYMITVGGDDGYRLSLDGGNTWVINRWFDQGYNTTTYSATLNGNYNMVLEFYENGGGNRLSFSMASTAILPVKLLSFTGRLTGDSKAELVWKCSDASNFSHFIAQKSADGRNFENAGTVNAPADFSAVRSFSFTDNKVSGTTYYRIAMVDRDGSIEYSSVVVIAAKTSSAARIYPTVVENGNVTVETGSGNAQYKLEIIDMNGRTIYSKPVAQGKQQVSLQMNRAKVTASYVARITSGNAVVLNQMIIVK